MRAPLGSGCAGVRSISVLRVIPERTMAVGSEIGSRTNPAPAVLLAHACTRSSAHDPAGAVAWTLDPRRDVRELAAGSQVRVLLVPRARVRVPRRQREHRDDHAANARADH